MRKEIETDFGKLFVEKKISEKQIEELVGYAASDEEVQENTHDKERFATYKKAQEWLSGERTVYTMTNEKGGLLGIVWFEKLSLPDGNLTEVVDREVYSHTFAIRIYPPLRGKRLAKKFMDVCFQDSGLKKVWLSVKQSNIPGITAYKKFGFKQITTPDSEGRVVMIYGGA